MAKGKINTWEKFLEITGGSKPVSHLVGIERQSVLDWKSSRKGIPLDHWRKLMSAYGLTADELFAVNENIQAMPL
jgi:hypothetical protein